mmetsp:Transcript_144499/g.402582  ORF Transcript_144499/g.402582 Transcript_144499/m.402582 type:complete len:656 (-) Transcript_144499:9-1976(-)
MLLPEETLGLPVVLDLLAGARQEVHRVAPGGAVRVPLRQRRAVRVCLQRGAIRARVARPHEVRVEVLQRRAEHAAVLDGPLDVNLHGVLEEEGQVRPVARAGAGVATAGRGVAVVHVRAAHQDPHALAREDLRLRPTVPVSAGTCLAAPLIHRRAHHAREISIRQHLPRGPVRRAPRRRVLLRVRGVLLQWVEPEGLLHRIRPVDVGLHDAPELLGSRVAPDVQQLVLEGAADDDGDGVVQGGAARQDRRQGRLLQVDVVDHWPVPLALGAGQHLKGILPLDARPVVPWAAQALRDVVRGGLRSGHGQRRPVREAPGHHDGLLEKAALLGHGEVHRDRRGAGRPPDDGHAPWVPAKVRDVALHPPQREGLVLRAPVPRGVVLGGAQVLAAQEAESAQAVVRGDHDHHVREHQLGGVLRRGVAAGAQCVATPVEPDEHRVEGAAHAPRGRVDVQVQAVLRDRLPVRAAGVHAGGPVLRGVEHLRVPRSGGLGGLEARCFAEGDALEDPRHWVGHAPDPTQARDVHVGRQDPQVRGDDAQEDDAAKDDHEQSQQPPPVLPPQFALPHTARKLFQGPHLPELDVGGEAHVLVGLPCRRLSQQGLRVGLPVAGKAAGKARAGVLLVLYGRHPAAARPTPPPGSRAEQRNGGGRGSEGRP